jgi:hypothetical protein
VLAVLSVSQRRENAWCDDDDDDDAPDKNNELDTEYSDVDNDNNK